MTERIAGMLGLARRAGKLTAGFDAVKDLLVSHKVNTVFLATDISPKTEKELRFAASDAVLFLTIGMTKDEIGHAIGNQKPVGAVTTEDKGFLRSMQNALRPNEEDAI